MSFNVLVDTTEAKQNYFAGVIGPSSVRGRCHGDDSPALSSQQHHVEYFHRPKKRISFLQIRDAFISAVYIKLLL